MRMRMSSKPARLRDAVMLQRTDLGDASVITGVQRITLLGCKDRRKARASLVGGGGWFLFLAHFDLAKRCRY